MNQRNILLATGIGCFLLFLLLFAPARLLTALLPADVFSATDLSGTIWNGHAQTANVAGVQLHDASWELHGLSLLIGRLSLTVDSKWADGFARGDVAVGLTGSLKVRDVQAVGPLAPVLQQLGMAGSGGDITIDIEQLDMADNWPTRIIGSARVGRLPLDMLGVGGGSAGSYSLEFEIDEVAGDGVIPGILSDEGGPLEVLGELRLEPPQSYSIQARVKTRGDAPPELAQALMLTGPRLPDGAHEFQMSGSL